MFSFILAVTLCYVVGSLPTAYLLVRWKSRIDIRSAGSGNVGTLNSYQVTRSAGIGVLVLCVDLIKGAAAVLLARLIAQENFAVIGSAGLAAVVGHNYPVWLRFRGGRGLAPGAGVMLVICWPAVAVWCILWGAAYGITRHVNVANVIACLVSLVASPFIPDAIVRALVLSGPGQGEFALFCVALFSVIVMRHIQPLKEYAVERNSTRDGVV